MTAPLVSVLMPVYNAGLHVEEAIRSILSQTFTNFELLVFNDGSIDNSSAIIKAIQDERIIFFDHAKNAGYVAHLNEGLRIARGKYIARMDADDIALPQRFAQQVALLEQRPEVGICGTEYDTFDAQSYVASVPISDAEIREYMLAYNPMGHPTVMFRKALVEQHGLCYEHSYMPAEDYKLWYEFSKIAKIENLPEILLHYRVHPHQISSYMNETQQLNANKIRTLQLTEKGFHLTSVEQQQYCQIFNPRAHPQTAADFEAMRRMMWKILDENERLQAYDATWFERLFKRAWHEAISNTEKYTFEHLRPMLLSPMPVHDTLSLSAKGRILVKGLLRWKARKRR
jgi:glycosyltransferase involved in cell wall biosynthesis